MTKTKIYHITPNSHSVVQAGLGEGGRLPYTCARETNFAFAEDVPPLATPPSPNHNTACVINPASTAMMRNLPLPP